MIPAAVEYNQSSSYRIPQLLEAIGKSIEFFHGNNEGTENFIINDPRTILCVAANCYDGSFGYDGIMLRKTIEECMRVYKRGGLPVIISDGNEKIAQVVRDFIARDPIFLTLIEDEMARKNLERLAGVCSLSLDDLQRIVPHPRAPTLPATILKAA